MFIIKKNREANLKKIDHAYLNKGSLNGEVTAGGFEWQFCWAFGNGDLIIEPSLGRALIEDALLRFLIKADFQLEPGSEYYFKVRSRF